MKHWIYYLLLFLSSGAVTLATALLMLRGADMSQRVPGGARAAGPLVAGVVWTLLIVALFAGRLSLDDPFFDAPNARQMVCGVGLAVLLLWSVDRFRDQRRNAGGGNSFWAWTAVYATVTCFAVLICVGTGTRFSILQVPFVRVFELGNLDRWATAVWILAGILLVKLLDGLRGAACAVLLMGSVAVAIPMIVRNEYVLAAVASGIAAASSTALYFARKGRGWDYRGAASLIAGLLFAVLTVLARQKTVAALVVVLPVGVIMLFAGGAMLKLLETLFVNSNPTNEKKNE